MKNHTYTIRFAFAAFFYFAFAGFTQAQVIRTVAGNGSQGYGGDGAPATAAQLSTPYGGAVDKAGNFYFSDQGNQRIREIVKSTGDIITIAGDGSQGYSGDGGAATAANLSNPVGVAVDTSGNVFFVDQGNYVVREINKSTGNIITVAGNGGYTFSGSPVGASSTGMEPSWVAVDDSDNLYITDAPYSYVYKVYAKNNTLVTIAGNGQHTYWADGGRADTSSLSYPAGIALDKNRNIYVADYNNARIRMINASTNIISTYCGNGITSETGDGGPADSAEIYSPTALAVDTVNGNLYLSDPNDAVRVVNGITHKIKVFAGSYGYGFSGDGSDATLAVIYGPQGLAVDGSNDNVYLADQDNERIREIFVTGPAITSQPAFSQSTICNYTSAAIGLTATGTGLTYQWQVDTINGWVNITNAGIYSGANTDSLKMSMVTYNGYSPSYRCVVTGSGVADTSKLAYLYITSLPQVSLTGPSDSVCSGSPVTLSATSYGGSGPIHPTHQFVVGPYGLAVWNNGDSTNNIQVFPTTTTTYSVALTEYGCTTDTTITVNVDRTRISATAFPSSSTCAGNSITLSGSGGDGSYTWSGSSSVTNNVGFTPSATSTYTVTGIDALGCIIKDSIKITVNPAPVVTVTSAPKDTICSGSSLTLSATGAISYNWSDGVTNGVAFTPSSSAIYNLTGTDANGCSAVVSVPVVVNPLPIITGTASPDAVCAGSSVSLSGNGALLTHGPVVLLMAWLLFPLFPDLYRYRYQCSRLYQYGSVNITVNPKPAITASAFPSAILCQGSSLALFGAGGASYAWTGGVNNGVSFTPSSSVTYTVTGIDANGCTN